ncbi:hypothetical protein E2C01_070035 [Portunus trituberculatus]|uniref:Uncharacterized protein n=1 Tax=Portunus trituberculatus TaxID=210409 RepID=A0A5B7HW93_PORTR|nr:hypothetical protein [Portunus trituberculatus]
MTSDLWVGQTRGSRGVFTGLRRGGRLENHVWRGTSGRLPLRQPGCLTHTAGGRAQRRGGLLGSGVQVPLYARSLTHSLSRPPQLPLASPTDPHTDRKAAAATAATVTAKISHTDGTSLYHFSVHQVTKPSIHHASAPPSASALNLPPARALTLFLASHAT